MIVLTIHSIGKNISKHKHVLYSVLLLLNDAISVIKKILLLLFI